MRSRTLPGFWDAYHRRASPFHPSLRFKCVNPEERIWSVRVTRGYRALGLMEGDGVTWFWVGSHEEYLRQF